MRRLLSIAVVVLAAAVVLSLLATALLAAAPALRPVKECGGPARFLKQSSVLDDS